MFCLIPAATDTQTCGLWALQYHAIIGETFAQSPSVLKKGGEALQQFIVDVILPQLQQVNLFTAKQYYKVVRAKLHQPNLVVPLRTHLIWPDIQTLPRKHKPPMQSRQETKSTRSDQAARRELRQMRLWETRPQNQMTDDSSPA